MMERRKAFQQLRTNCVELIQAASSLAQRPSAKKDVVQALTNLLLVLREFTTKPDSLDAKLAEFVFVPISQVFRASRVAPVRALELSLECLMILLQTGWKGNLSSELSGQLLILLTFLANPLSTENGIPATSEELQAAAFRCMAELLLEMTSTQELRSMITGTEHVPTLSKAVLVTVDSLAGAPSNEIKLEALTVIRVLSSGVDDKEALASFFPRIVSSITKVLTPGNSNRVGFRVLQQGLDTLSVLLSTVLSDRETANLPLHMTDIAPQDTQTVLRTDSWLQATASQVKIALANVLKLRRHDKLEVRQALFQLCTRLLQDCRESLSECISMLVETMVSLASYGEGQNTSENTLNMLLSFDAQLASLLRESLRGWVISLPRVIRNGDDNDRRQVIHQISIAIRLLDNVDLDITTINSLLTKNMQDSIVGVLKDDRGTSYIHETLSGVTAATTSMLKGNRSLVFQALKLRSKGQEDIMHDFKLLVQQLAKSDSANFIARDLVDTAGAGPPEMRTATFWLSVNLLGDMIQNDSAIDQFLDLASSNVRMELLDELYPLSLTALDTLESDVVQDWRSQALALEIIAMQASRHGHDFRVELIEALYPVLHLLGTPSPELQAHTMTCLNIIAQACEYTSASDLVVSNVDYIVNAVGLKLNYHDISPQAPQVLLMMLRLCGPSLLPYLDDLISSMFSALERYHGYPRIVELLFAVLKGIAEEGIKSPHLMLLNTSDKQEVKTETGMAEIVTLLKGMEKDACLDDEDHQRKTEASFPQRPWKEEIDKNESADGFDGEHLKSKDDSVQPANNPIPPISGSFATLLKISDLTQHYLTSPSSNLRSSLLSLLHTTIPTLARHENSFLPLINTLWPVLLPRLDDPEAYIVSNALDTITLMCTHAGAFMKGRIEAAWEKLKILHHRTSLRAYDQGRLDSKSVHLNSSLVSITKNPTTSDMDHFRPELYTDTPTRMIHESYIRLFSTIAQHVAIKDDTFDDLVDMVEADLNKGNVRKALEKRNPDAIWLRMLKRQHLASAGTEVLEANCRQTKPRGGRQWTPIEMFSH